MNNSNSPPPNYYWLFSEESRNEIQEIKTTVKFLESSIKKLMDPDPLKGYIAEEDAKVKFKRGTTWFWNRRQEGLPSIKIGSTNYYPIEKLLQFFVNENNSTVS